jgi:DNA-binding PadR family transcriptional regulator
MSFAKNFDPEQPDQPGRRGGHRHHGGPRGWGRFAEGRAAFGPFGPGPGGPGGPGFGPGPFGPWGPPFGRGPRGRGGRGRARRGNVRASLLALLKERPMHGYEMIQQLGELTQGAWRPSPGSVYPTLQLLEEEGLITSQEEGGKRLFSLTETGRAEAENGPEAPWTEAGPDPEEWAGFAEAKQAVVGLMHAFQQVNATGTAEQREKAQAVLNEARKKLYLILAEED